MAQTVSSWIDRWSWWSIATQDLAKVILEEAKRQVRETAADAEKRETVILEHRQIVQLLN